MPAQSNDSLDANTASALSYVIGPFSGVVFLILGKTASVKFHAMQSTLIFGTFIVLQIAISYIPYMRSLLPLLSVAAFILWLTLIYKAWQGDEWEVPIFGTYARQFVKKV